jgi:hypothetical protein
MDDNNDTPASAQVSIPAAASPASEELTLVEFCMRLSKSDGRVELIGGFHQSEVAAGHVKDVESEFQSRFNVFINQPV